MEGGGGGGEEVSGRRGRQGNEKGSRSESVRPPLAVLWVSLRVLFLLHPVSLSPSFYLFILLFPLFTLPTFPRLQTPADWFSWCLVSCLATPFLMHIHSSASCRFFLPNSLSVLKLQSLYFGTHGSPGENSNISFPFPFSKKSPSSLCFSLLTLHPTPQAKA